jgi:hypothetical protein
MDESEKFYYLGQTAKDRLMLRLTREKQAGKSSQLIPPLYLGYGTSGRKVP